MKRIVIHLCGGAFDGRTLDSHSADGLSLAAACECYAMTSGCVTGKRFGIACNDHSATVVHPTMAGLFGDQLGIYEIKVCDSGESQMEAFAESVADSKG